MQVPHHVLAQFEVGGKVQPVFDRIISKRLDHNVGYCLAWPDVARNKLCDNVKEHALVCRPLQNALGNDEKRSQAAAKDDEAPDGELSWPVSNSKDSESTNDKSENTVPPVGDFLVAVSMSVRAKLQPPWLDALVHQPFVDILTAVSRILKLGHNVRAIPEGNIDNHGGDCCK